jgi:hypothetical protein
MVKINHGKSGRSGVQNEPPLVLRRPLRRRAFAYVVHGGLALLSIWGLWITELQTELEPFLMILGNLVIQSYFLLDTLVPRVAIGANTVESRSRFGRSRRYPLAEVSGVQSHKDAWVITLGRGASIRIPINIIDLKDVDEVRQRLGAKADKGAKETEPSTNR